VAAIEGEEDTQFADTTLESILRDIRTMNRRAKASQLTMKESPRNSGAGDCRDLFLG
jgi:hypothetical protein